jgi:hypothetical protein
MAAARAFVVLVALLANMHAARAQTDTQLLCQGTLNWEEMGAANAPVPNAPLVIDFTNRRVMAPLGEYAITKVAPDMVHFSAPLVEGGRTTGKVEGSINRLSGVTTLLATRSHGHTRAPFWFILNCQPARAVF